MRINRNGNLYPQHGLGPAAQMMDLNYGDRMMVLSSISSDDFSMGKKMEEAASLDPCFNAYTGLPLEMDVYDAALWTAVTPLSEWSVARQGASVKVPDFTNGAWKTNKRGMDVGLREGGEPTWSDH